MDKQLKKQLLDSIEGILLPEDHPLMVCDVDSPQFEKVLQEYCNERDTMKSISISLEEFATLYKPIPHPNSDQTGAPSAWYFETYGDDMEQVDKTPAHQIWTVIETDGVSVIQSGRTFVNRLNYILTEIPFNARERITILLD